MPIHLVRWPDLSAALVKAGSEDDLIDILDEVANPEGCAWSVYRGPLFVEFSLPARFQVEEGGTKVHVAAAPHDELESTASAAPPMTGAEYVTAAVLHVATYTTRLSAHAKAQHVPLGQARRAGHQRRDDGGLIDYQAIPKVEAAHGPRPCTLRRRDQRP